MNYFIYWTILFAANLNCDRCFLSNLALGQTFFLYLIIAKICLLLCTCASTFTETLNEISWKHLQKYKHWNRTTQQLKLQCFFFFFFLCGTSYVYHTGKKVKYQFWNNTRTSVVLYWDIIGRFTGIPTLEKWYKYQCWYVKIISQQWEIIILIGR